MLSRVWHRATGHHGVPPPAPVVNAAEEKHANEHKSHQTSDDKAEKPLYPVIRAGDSDYDSVKTAAPMPNAAPMESAPPADLESDFHPLPYDPSLAPPPSYAQSYGHQAYRAPVSRAAPVASLAEPVRAQPSAPPSIVPAIIPPPQSVPTTASQAVAVPVMVPPPTLSDRLFDTISTIQNSAHYQRAHSTIKGYYDKHLPPELRQFVRQPSIGQLMFNPALLFMAYNLYKAVKAPFVGVFKAILVGAAMKALVNEQHSTDHSLHHRMVVAGLRKVANCDDFAPGTMSGDVMRKIVENLSMSQITQLFGWFQSPPPAPAAAAAPT